jgi:hypothetical protein
VVPVPQLGYNTLHSVINFHFADEGNVTLSHIYTVSHIYTLSHIFQWHNYVISHTLVLAVWKIWDNLL